MLLSPVCGVCSMQGQSSLLQSNSQQQRLRALLWTGFPVVQQVSVLSAVDSAEATTSCTEDRAGLLLCLLERVLPLQTVKKAAIITRPHRGGSGQNGSCEGSGTLWKLNNTWLWHQDNNLLLAASRNIIYLISHAADSFKCVLYKSSKALCSVWSATNVQKMFYFESIFYFCTVFMDSTVNVTLLWRGEMHQSRFTRCIKYTSIGDNDTHFEGKICQWLKC